MSEAPVADVAVDADALREEVKSKPEGYRIVSRRGAIAIDGLEHESRPVFSFQFHPEAGTEFAEYAGVAPEALDNRQRADSRLLLDAFRNFVHG